ncbi:MAG: hypothetical protein ABI430_02140 [Candidatus Taylorbacteria bacterium]
MRTFWRRRPRKTSTYPSRIVLWLVDALIAFVLFGSYALLFAILCMVCFQSGTLVSNFFQILSALPGAIVFCLFVSGVLNSPLGVSNINLFERAAFSLAHWEMMKRWNFFSLVWRMLKWAWQKFYSFFSAVLAAFSGGD